MNILQLLQQETIRNELNLVRMEASTRDRILKLLKDLENEIVGQLASADPTAPAMTAYKQARLTKLLKEVKSTIRVAYKQISKTAKDGLDEAALAASSMTGNAINFAVGAKIAKASLAPSLLRTIVDDTLVEAAPSAEWWARQPDELTQKFYDQMRLGLAKGDTIDQLVQRVRGVPARGGKLAKSGIMTIAKHNAAALVRTATQSITNQARISSMTANKDVVNGVQWLATLDSRTTQICRELDGLTWYLKDGVYVPNGHNYPFPGPTAHWGCRSIVLPWLKSWTDMAGPGADKGLLAKLDAIPEGTRSSLNGQVPATMSYADWLGSVPKKEAVGALGGQKNYDLWKAGKLAPHPELAAKKKV